MKERLREIRKAKKLTQAAMAQRLNLSLGGYAKIETGENSLTDRVFSDICRIFNVNEDWLRTGDGEMFNPASSIDAELMRRIGEVVNSNNEFVKQAVLLSVMAMQNMSDTQQDDFIRIIRNMVASLPPDDEQ